MAIVNPLKCATNGFESFPRARLSKLSHLRDSPHAPGCALLSGAAKTAQPGVAVLLEPARLIEWLVGIHGMGRQGKPGKCRKRSCGKAPTTSACLKATGAGDI